MNFITKQNRLSQLYFAYLFCFCFQFSIAQKQPVKSNSIPTDPSKLDCPDIYAKKKKNIFLSSSNSKLPVAYLIKESAMIHFDIIKVEDKKLEIPAFKQFKNNMTDFTAEGEKEFQTIVIKIRDYLKNNAPTNKKLTLYVIGSASQIPTSFDQNKPNNNINPDGSSIKGQTSIENNKMLAQARAQLLAKKLNELFTDIEILTPNLDEIQIGTTVWDNNAQMQLNKAVETNANELKRKVFEPFQKDQFVKVISLEQYFKTYKPNSLTYYYVKASPPLIYKEKGGKEEKVYSSFVVSNLTYDILEGSQAFYEEGAREAFLIEKGLKIIKTESEGKKKWYLSKGSRESATILSAKPELEKIKALYRIGIIAKTDEKLIENIIFEEFNKNHKMTFKSK